MAQHPTRGLRRRTPSEPPEPPETPLDGTTHPAGRWTRTGRARPNGRAVVGGLLVTVAAVAVFAAYSGAETGPDRTAVAAREALPAGHRLTRDDLTLVDVALPPGSAGATFTAVEQVVGSITLAPLDDDDLVQRSAVRTEGADLPAADEFSFPIDRERALAGDLKPGEAVDILATYGSGADSYTAVLSRGSTVVAVQGNGRGTIGGSGSLVLTVALASGDEVLDVAHAAQVAHLTVVRATRSDRTQTGRDTTTAPTRGSGPSTAVPGAGT